MSAIQVLVRGYMGVVWTLLSALSNMTGNFMTRCPKCSPKMKRMEMHDQTYTRAKKARFTSMARPTSTLNTELGRRALLQVQVVPVYDVCTECGHWVRRKNMELS